MIRRKARKQRAEVRAIIRVVKLQLATEGGTDAVHTRPEYRQSADYAH